MFTLLPAMLQNGGITAPVYDGRAGKLTVPPPRIEAVATVDGVLSEGAMRTAGSPSAGGRFENVDLNPDFIFVSRGRLTEVGYEVEVFVPFKSLRYQARDPQNRALNIVRKVQHSGYQDTWAPVHRAGAYFPAKSGSLTDLTGLRRGLVLSLNPFTTGKATGRPDPSGWSYDVTSQVGGNARWRITENLTLDATANPDFSQVEADVGRVTINERFALFFPEKRPFFLEGIELFDAPNQLVYTRRIHPDFVAASGFVPRTGIVEPSRSWPTGCPPTVGPVRCWKTGPLTS